MCRPRHKPMRNFLGLETEWDCISCKCMIDIVRDCSLFPGWNQSTRTGNPLNSEDLQGC